MFVPLWPLGYGLANHQSQQTRGVNDASSLSPCSRAVVPLDAVAAYDLTPESQMPVGTMPLT